MWFDKVGKHHIKRHSEAPSSTTIKRHYEAPMDRKAFRNHHREAPSSDIINQFNPVLETSSYQSLIIDHHYLWEVLSIPLSTTTPKM